MSTGFWMAFGLGAGAGSFVTALVAVPVMKLRRAWHGFNRRL